MTLERAIMPIWMPIGCLLDAAEDAAEGVEEENAPYAWSWFSIAYVYSEYSAVHKLFIDKSNVVRQDEARGHELE